MYFQYLDTHTQIFSQNPCTHIVNTMHVWTHLHTYSHIYKKITREKTQVNPTRKDERSYPHVYIEYIWQRNQYAHSYIPTYISGSHKKRHMSIFSCIHKMKRARKSAHILIYSHVHRRIAHEKAHVNILTHSNTVSTRKSRAERARSVDKMPRPQTIDLSFI